MAFKTDQFGLRGQQREFPRWLVYRPCSSIDSKAMWGLLLLQEAHIAKVHFVWEEEAERQRHMGHLRQKAVVFKNVTGF